MLRRKLGSLFRISPSSQASPSGSNPVNEEKGRSFGRKAVSTALLCLTGGVALSAIDDLAIYHGCSSKAMEKACKNQDIIRAIGDPVVKGPWYSASMAVAHKRNSVSCTFPVSGPQGNGVLRLKGVRSGDDSWLSFLRPREFDILILDAILYVPGNEEAQRTVKINVSDAISPSACQPAQRTVKINVSDELTPPACQPCMRCPEPARPDKQ